VSGGPARGGGCDELATGGFEAARCPDVEADRVGERDAGCHESSEARLDQHESERESEPCDDIERETHDTVTWADETYWPPGS
jgi:hypothetical protein